MTEDFNEIKPGAQAVAESVTRKRAALEAKHIILTDRPEDVAAYLPKYHHTMHEIIEIGPWQSYGAFREGAGRNMTRLFLSDEARVACAEQLSRLTDVQKRASYLFSYEDVADWIHENVESEVMSVLVPLSMFATDPDAFRAQFLEERGKRFVRLEDAITKGKSPARTPLSKWRVTRILPASVQSELGRWQEDYNAERERQGVAWPNPTSLTVDFPEGVLARYKAMKELAPTTARARATVLFEGFAVHREVGHTQPHCRRHYTPGLLLGKPIHWKDYELGLVDLMSIPRATALLGADYLRKAPWRLGKEDVAWCRDESVLHEVKLSREFRILLGIQRGGQLTNLDVGRDGQNARLQYRDDDGVAPRLRLRILFAPGQRHADACGHEVSVNQSDAGGLIMRDRPFSFVVYSSEIRDFGVDARPRRQGDGRS